MARICVIGPSKRFFSGLSACTICLANALSRGNDVSVVLLRNLLPRFLYPGKAHLDRQDYLLDFFSGVRVFEGMDWNNPLGWLRGYRFLREREPDVLIMLWWTSSVAHMQLFLALANGLRMKCKLIVELHEIVDPLEQSMLPIRLYSRIMGRLLMTKADGFVVHSAAVKNQAVRTYGLEEDRVFIIPHGLFDIYYQDYDKEALKNELGVIEGFVILYFGTIRRHKGVPFLVEAFGKVPDNVGQHSRLVIAGEDWGDQDSLGHLIDSSPYKEHITYRPEFVPDAMIAKYFSIADVVVLPYLRTAGSGVANIAMTYGKPIITSDLEAMRECLMDYEGAVFVRPGDSVAMAEKLVEIHDLYTSGTITPCPLPRNTWDEITGQYELIIEYLGRLS